MDEISEKKPKKKPGPDSIWHGELGETRSTHYRAKDKIISLILEKPVKRLLNWMALDERFKKEILNQVPNRTPYAPKDSISSEDFRGL